MIRFPDAPFFVPLPCCHRCSSLRWWLEYTESELVSRLGTNLHILLFFYAPIDILLPAVLAGVLSCGHRMCPAWHSSARAFSEALPPVRRTLVAEMFVSR